MEGDPCAGKLGAIDAFLYGLPGGFVLAAILLVCFVGLGKALTTRKVRRQEASASSNTRDTKDTKFLLGKRKRRGPPPSSQLRKVDVMSMAYQETAPDDIRQTLIQSGKMTQTQKEPGEFVQLSKIDESPASNAGRPNSH